MNLLALHLQEYQQLFHENQDIAWLDKIDKRYAWLKRSLLDFEEKYGRIFPVDWEVSERIAIRFCAVTRDELAAIATRRRSEIDVKLLLFAIAKTSSFELLLAKRFTGITFADADVVAGVTTATTIASAAAVTADSVNPSSAFVGLIGACFKPLLDIYTDSIDRNLTEILDRFMQDSKIAFDPAVNNSTVFPRFVVQEIDGI